MNCKLLKFCWISILLFFLYGYSFAQKDTQPSTGSSIDLVNEDSTASDSATGDSENVADTLIIKSVFDNTSDSILKWKQEKEFGYMAYLDSLLRKKTDLRIDTVSIDKGAVKKNRADSNPDSAINSNSFLNSFGVRFFFWVIAIFFIGFILYKLFFTGGLFAKGNAKVGNEPAHKEPESLNEYSEYNILIHEAELKNDFNLSVRYLYLQSLKKLADGELISFSPDKANNLYVKELSGRSYQQEFAFLTLSYEYAWYGRFIIDLVRYRKLKEQFILFNKKV